MASMNKVILIGNLGGEPELKTSQAGKPYMHISLATNEGRGEKQRTEWHNLVLFDKTAEFVASFLHKGDNVYVEGSIHTNSWEDKESGQKRYKTEIRVYQLLALGARKQAEQTSGADPEDFGEEIPF